MTLPIKAITGRSLFTRVLIFMALVTVSACGGGGGGGGGGSGSGSFTASTVFTAYRLADQARGLFATNGSGQVIKLSADLVIDGNVGSYVISPNGQYVAYIADQDTDEVFELYVVAINGGTPVKVSGMLTGGGNVGGFSWAPDSSRIAYFADQDINTVNELYTSTPDGSSKVKVSKMLLGSGSVAGFDWAPDSSRIAYIAAQDTILVEELYTTTPDGSTNVKVSGMLATSGNVLSFKWAPDSSRIAYMADQDTDQVIELYTSTPAGATNNVKISGLLVTNGSLTSFVNIWAWAPDSSRIAYAADQDTDQVVELYTSTPDGVTNIKVSGVMVLNGSIDALLSPITWSPDSSRIAYTADQTTDGVIELFTSTPDSAINNVKVSGTMATGGNVISDYRWAPDSLRIAYRADQDMDTIDELYTSTPDGSINVKVSGMLVGGGIVTDFDWAPDSSRIAYIADQDTDQVVELYTSTPDGTTNNVKISGSMVANGSLPARGLGWASDSSRIAYLADQDTDQVVELYTSTPESAVNNTRISGTLSAGESVFSSQWVN